MNAIDLIVWIVLALAVWGGWKQGLIVQICSLAGIVAGIWLAAHFGAQAGAWLGLDGDIAAPGGFVAVLVAVVLAVAVVARLIRKLFRFAGFGVADVLLGIVVATLKYMLVLSVLFSAFDSLNADYAIVGRETIDGSACYGPVMRLSDAVFPFLEWVGERIPQ